jgi:hypothetical protein
MKLFTDLWFGMIESGLLNLWLDHFKNKLEIID